MALTTNDPIADMLTRIRNANTAKHDTVDVPASKMKIAIANILVDEGYIAKYDLVEDGNFKTIRITLKYGKDKNEKIISGLKRISKPGLRVYANKEELPKVLGGLGVANKIFLCLPEDLFLIQGQYLAVSHQKFSVYNAVRHIISADTFQKCIYRIVCGKKMWLAPVDGDQIGFEPFF